MKPKRGFWKTCGLVLLVMAAMLALMAAIAYSMGIVDVSVQEKGPDGTHVHLLVPAPAVTLGLRFVPAGDLSEGSSELRPWMPAIRAASKELARTEDATLVDVRDADQTVTISKRGGSLVIDVNSAEDVVHVSVPLSTLATVAEKVAADERPGTEAP
ncbi:MAG TPA: hypothetical protein VGW33_05800 [Terriglobia bacterium]|nr:hypothetical protein [Terriglobia bacterium]